MLWYAMIRIIEVVLVLVEREECDDENGRYLSLKASQIPMIVMERESNRMSGMSFMIIIGRRDRYEMLWKV